MSDTKSILGPGGISRRGFLKGVGAGTAVVGLLGGAEHGAAVADEARPAVVGPGEIAIKLKINGQMKDAKVEPRTTLLDTLRNRLDMTGAKKVCDRGTCGACTVLVDGLPVYSCTLLALEAEGREITTVEGIGTPDNLSPMQKAFIEHDGSQCGFCTPGLIVASTAFAREHPNATLDEVRAGLGGNLCRCGTYAGVMEAVVDAAKNMGGAK